MKKMYHFATFSILDTFGHFGTSNIPYPKRVKIGFGRLFWTVIKTTAKAWWRICHNFLPSILQNQWLLYPTCGLLVARLGPRHVPSVHLGCHICLLFPHPARPRPHHEVEDDATTRRRRWTGCGSDQSAARVGSGHSVSTRWHTWWQKSVICLVYKCVLI